MRRLLLLRHAKSDRPADVPDLDRPLNPRGRDAARKIGAYMARHKLIPDIILCSPATRARETLAEVYAELPIKPPSVHDERLYNAGPEAMLEALRDTASDAATVLVVGHNPDIQQLALLLIASGDLDLRERMHEQYPTASLAIIDFAFREWDKLHPHSGRLERFIIPREIEATID